MVLICSMCLFIKGFAEKTARQMTGAPPRADRREAYAQINEQVYIYENRAKKGVSP